MLLMSEVPLSSLDSGPTAQQREDRVLDGPASGEKGSSRSSQCSRVAHGCDERVCKPYPRGEKLLFVDCASVVLPHVGSRCVKSLRYL